MNEEVNEKNFRVKLINERNKISQFYFWKEGCDACTFFMPILEQVNSEFSEEIKLFKVNTDFNPELAAELNIYASPMILSFYDSKLIDTCVGGFVKAEYYKEHLNNIIAKSKLSKVVF